MPWVKLDDGFASHPKTIAAGPQAVALFISSLCWCARNLTDGRIPKHVLPALLAEAAVRRPSADRLVTVGYWHDRGDHWEINGYLERNPSRQQVEKERARWRRYKGSSNVDSTAESNVESTRDSAVASAPSRPDPSRNDLQPPTTEHRWTPQGRAEEVMNLLLQAERAATTNIRDKRSWERSVSARLELEHGARARELTAAYEDAPPSVIAGHLRGEGNTLRYYTKTEPA